jgi:hypothetical protein
MKRWCIVNEDGIRDADFADPAPIGQDFCDERHRPKCFHLTLESAEAEMLRLQMKMPGSTFTLFEAVAQTSKKYIPRQIPELVAFIDPVTE